MRKETSIDLPVI